MDRRSQYFVIGLNGDSGAGKDTAADIIVNKLLAEGVASKLSFASELKKLCRSLFPMLHSEEDYNRRRDLREVKKKRYNNMTAVDIWIHVGQSMREVDPNVWINKLHNTAKNLPSSIVVIPDVRSPNEVEFVKKNGIMIRLEAEDTKVNAMDNKFDCDYTIHNPKDSLELFGSLLKQVLNVEGIGYYGIH